MKKRWLLLCITILLCSNNLLSQARASKTLQFLPYAGLSSPQGDFKKLSDNGSVFGLSIDKYLSSKFALGLDINYQLTAFKNKIDYSIIPSPSVVKTLENGTWSNATLTFGPTYSFGNQKFNTEIYTKAGVSFVKSPSSTTTLSHPAFQDFDIFDLKEQQVTSFGLTSGIRFNYSINEKIALFINPQYVISGAEINYYYKDPTIAYFPGIDGADDYYDPGVLLENPGIEAVVKPSYFNLNFGVKISLEKLKETTPPQVNRNIPICDIEYDSITCRGSSQTITLTSTWFGQNSNSTIDIKIYNGSNLLVSGNSITNNNLVLGTTSGTRSHSFTISNSYIGSMLNAIITIDDQYGVVACSSPVEFEVPSCPLKPCEFEINITNIICGVNSVTFNATSSWTNVVAGSTIDIIAYQGNTNVPLNISPNNLPLTISGTGTVNHNITISNAYVGQAITIGMRMTDPTTGQVKICGGLDLIIPPCNEPACELIENASYCQNGTNIIDFTFSWANYTNFSNYSIYAEIIDAANNTPIYTYPVIPLSSASGSGPVRQIIPSQYAGSAVYVKIKICETVSGGIKNCCEKIIKIKIPQCCEICLDITLDDTTDVNQSNGQIFKIKGNLNPVSSNSSPIKKIIAQLETISFSDRSTPSTPAPNYEFIGGWFGNILGSYPANLTGSLYSNRSNLIKVNVNVNTATNMSFFLNIDNYSNKIVEEYRIKLTIFKQDGTYCEKEMYYSRWLEFWRNLNNNN